MSVEDHNSTRTVCPQETLEANPSPQNPSTGCKSETTPDFARTRDFGFLPIPRQLRFQENEQVKFGIVLQLTFFFATTFTIQNLYYCQPLLITFSKVFNVSYSEVARIPTLTQAGYAAGLVLITPLGDLSLRRPLLLILVLLSASLTIGLAVTNSVIVFEILSFLTGMASVTPQILIPLTADLAPPNRRSSAVSITFSGLLFGILLGRVLSGTIAQFSNWRNVYYMAVGLQFGILLLLYLVIPDYPAKNPDVGYFEILWTMAWFAVSEPVLIQACIVSCAASATFASFWVTLTFLLGESPYNYSDLRIGIFGLVGMAGVAIAPLGGRAVDLLVPWNVSILATLAMIVFQAVQAGAGGINIGAVILACFGVDAGRQVLLVSLAAGIFEISHAARARLNAVYIFSLCLGQLMGTAVGTKVFVEHGWRAAALLSLAWVVFQLGILMLRGPHAARKTWFGWEGGWSFRPLQENDTQTVQEASNEKEKDP